MANDEQFELSEELQDIADQLRALGQTGLSMPGGKMLNTILRATSTCWRWRRGSLR